MQEFEQITIVAGETDISGVPEEILEALIQATKRAANETLSRIEKLSAELEPLQKMHLEIVAEHERLKEELWKRTMTKIEKVTALVDQHNKDFENDASFFKEGLKVVQDERGNIFINIPLPNCNSEWTFAVWEWARTFCKKHPGFYPNHTANSGKFVSLKLSMNDQPN
jgi:hypothetical protein